METEKNSNDAFVGYNGRQQWLRHEDTGLKYTVGVKLMSKKLKGEWFINEVLRLSPWFEEMRQIWTLQRLFNNNIPTDKFTLYMQDETGHLVFATSVLENVTDSDTITGFVDNDLLMLESER